MSRQRLGKAAGARCELPSLAFLRARRLPREPARSAQPPIIGSPRDSVDDPHTFRRIGRRL